MAILDSAQPTHDPADLLSGAAAIAAFLFGDIRYARRVYRICATSNFPAFKLGTVLCSRKSSIVAWIVEQEKEGIEIKEK